MPQYSKENIMAGRNAVDAYRADHAKLYDKPWHRGIPEEHTPLLDKLLVELKGQGFNSLGEFFSASEEQNMQELGYEDRQHFTANATDTDWQALNRMWH